MSVAENPFARGEYSTAMRYFFSFEAVRLEFADEAGVRVTVRQEGRPRQYFGYAV